MSHSYESELCSSWTTQWTLVWTTLINTTFPHMNPLQDWIYFLFAAVFWSSATCILLLLFKITAGVCWKSLPNGPLVSGILVERYSQWTGLIDVPSEELIRRQEIFLTPGDCSDIRKISGKCVCQRSKTRYSFVCCCHRVPVRRGFIDSAQCFIITCQWNCQRNDVPLRLLLFKINLPQLM